MAWRCSCRGTPISRSASPMTARSPLPPTPSSTARHSPPMRWNCPDCVLIPPPCARRTWTGWWPMAGVTRSVVWWLRSVSNTSCLPRPPSCPTTAGFADNPTLHWCSTLPPWLCIGLRHAARVELSHGAARLTSKHCNGPRRGSWAPRRSRPREVSTGAAVKPPEVCASSAPRSGKLRREAPDGW